MYKLNYFNFKERDSNFLITNDVGKYCFISKKDFNNLIKKEELPIEIKKDLLEKGFIYKFSDEIFSNSFSQEVRKVKSYIFSATSLHIFVVSKSCNFRCIYCQAGNLTENIEQKMTKEIAKKAVDIAMQSPERCLSFEFQGGEPLTNFEVIKYIIEYSQGINTNKDIEYNLVSNLTLMTDEMLEFFIKNNVSICTSIDGNKILQNLNRPYPGKSSYDETIKKMKEIQKLNIKVGAIETTSKYNLDKYKELIDEYIKLGLDSIFLRPLTQLGKADKNWEKIGYSADEFLEFYKKALQYIILKNKQGYFLAETHSAIFLKKILLNEPINYMELRSPCGGAIGQIAYYYDGEIYTCDEGRMLAEMGDNSFKLGNVFENNFKELMESDITKAMCISSCLECLPLCSTCAYMPYCGTCPVINLAQDNNIFSKGPNEYKCKVYKGMLDILFDYIENDKDTYDVFLRWIN